MEVKRSGMIHYVLVINMKDLKLLQITNWAHTHVCMQALYNYVKDVCLSLSAWGQNNHQQEVGPIENVLDELRWESMCGVPLETLAGCQDPVGSQRRLALSLMCPVFSLPYCLMSVCSVCQFVFSPQEWDGAAAHLRYIMQSSHKRCPYRWAI